MAQLRDGHAQTKVNDPFYGDNVGGIAEQVDETILAGAFNPFGEINALLIPRDSSKGAKGHRGFGFVEYQEADDAQHAMDNMNDSELFGRVLKVNIAKPNAMKAKAVWENADAWYDTLKPDGSAAVGETKGETKGDSGSSLSQYVASNTGGDGGDGDDESTSGSHAGGGGRGGRGGRGGSRGGGGGERGGRGGRGRGRGRGGGAGGTSETYTSLGGQRSGRVSMKEMDARGK